MCMLRGPELDTMQRALIKPEFCLGCKACAVADMCPFQSLIREDPRDKPWVDFLKCSGCAKCKHVCRGRAIEYVTQPCTGRARMSW